MISVNLKLRSGERCTVQGRAGFTLMEVCVANDVEGIDAECGGSAACGTCHVVIDDNWSEKVVVPAALEEDMLAGLENRHQNSRLACQIRLAEGLDGLEAQIPLP